MRFHKHLLILLLFYVPSKIVAQTTSIEDIDITGLWKGTLYNDSTHQLYRYEIGISNEKGKLSGFSHTWYNDSAKYFVIKKIKLRRTAGKIIIEDVDIISYNYPEAPPKGVRRLHVLTLQAKDSILILSGIFTTNRTKQYSPATGIVSLQRNNDFRQSSLLPELRQLGMEKELSFIAAKNPAPVEEIDKSLTKSGSSINSLPQTNHPQQEPKIIGKAKAIPPGKIKAIEIKKPETVIEPAAEVLARKNIVQETMYFTTDSLELTLYDNGEVDGDTVSVLVNGNIFMAKQGLSTNAIRKTVYIDPLSDSVQLLMYAENLGKIPPNSGLLIVKDGKDIHEVRFSGDLQKNAAIILKRKKN